MAGKGSYVPPQYIPLYSTDTEEDGVPAVEENHAGRHKLSRDPTQWSSGICACFDDPQSCLVLAVPGSAVACYACGYRSALRTKYNLPEAPCGDLTTHLFCHLCAICQEYREIRERTGSSSSSSPNVTPPPVQTMDEP
nr:unnamed protein product [Digitaria exilis]